MSLVSPSDVKALVNTPVADDDLQVIINRIEAQITSKIGAPQNDEYTVQLSRTLRGEGTNLFLPTEIYAVVSIVEDGVTLAADEYRVWSGGVLERLPMDTRWGDVCVVTYKPADDRELRTQVVIDLARLSLERTAMKSESIGGEYSYSAPENWEAEWKRVMKRLMFQAV